MLLLSSRRIWEKCTVSLPSWKHTDPNNLFEQKIKDCYYGNSDTVGNKLFKEAAVNPYPSPVEDRTITTFYIENISTLTELYLWYFIYLFIYGILFIILKIISFLFYAYSLHEIVIFKETTSKLIGFGNL